MKYRLYIIVVFIHIPYAGYAEEQQEVSVLLDFTTSSMDYYTAKIGLS